MSGPALKPDLRISPLVARAVAFWRRLSDSVSRFLRLLRAIPRPVLLGALVLLVLGVGILEREAQLKRELELLQLRRQAAKEVSDLRGRADAAIAAFRSNAGVIRELEARRQALEREAGVLRRRLASLREEERVRVQRAVTPGQAEMSGGVVPPLDAALPTAAPAVGAPVPETPPSPEAWRLGAGTPLDACRAQSAVKDQLISNCEQRLTAGQAVIDATNRSVGDLQRAIHTKDEIAARLEAQHRAELQGARGPRWKRLGRALQYVGVGVVIGVLVAR